MLMSKYILLTTRNKPAQLLQSGLLTAPRRPISYLRQFFHPELRACYARRRWLIRADGLPGHRPSQAAILHDWPAQS